MFTGIIEELGTITSITMSTSKTELVIAAERILSDVKLGDSIAVNGMCLTVTQFSAKQFTADVMPETLKATSFHQLKKGSLVNLELAMPANGRFGGHLVTGHVDGTATIVKKTKLANAVYIELAMAEELIQHCLVKGSIAIDGTSLTLFEVNPKTVTVSLIPHTNQETLLGKKQRGEVVNIETDLISKYISKHLSNTARTQLDLNKLKKAGF